MINDIGPSGRSLESEVVRPLPAAPTSGVENVTGDVSSLVVNSLQVDNSISITEILFSLLIFLLFSSIK